MIETDDTTNGESIMCHAVAPTNEIQQLLSGVSSFWFYNFSSAFDSNF